MLNKIYNIKQKNCPFFEFIIKFNQYIHKTGLNNVKKVKILKKVISQKLLMLFINYNIISIFYIAYCKKTISLNTLMHKYYI